MSSTAEAAGDSVQAWGFNGQGQLGNGAVTAIGCQCVATPAPVSRLGGAAAVAGGADFSLALMPAERRFRI